MARPISRILLYSLTTAGPEMTRDRPPPASCCCTLPSLGLPSTHAPLDDGSPNKPDYFRCKHRRQLGYKRRQREAEGGRGRQGRQPEERSDRKDSNVHVTTIYIMFLSQPALLARYSRKRYHGPNAWLEVEHTDTIS